MKKAMHCSVGIVSYQEYTSYLSLPLAQPELLARLTGPVIGLLSLTERVLNAIAAVGYLGSQQPSLYYRCGFCTDIYFQCSWASSYESNFWVTW